MSILFFDLEFAAWLTAIDYKPKVKSCRITMTDK